MIQLINKFIIDKCTNSTCNNYANKTNNCGRKTKGYKGRA
ncbi:Cba (plasmid) [Escherichia coli APEC O1]|uniref:Cba n=1 Tax=Escherichia coli O1:K1 / APEC TaxID=405955 RepID=A0A0H2XL56_ECOK1|nr:Cba [Escherichia coli APEC O1]